MVRGHIFRAQSPPERKVSGWRRGIAASVCAHKHGPDSVTPPALDSSQSSVASKAMAEIISEERFWVALPPIQFPKALQINHQQIQGS